MVIEWPIKETHDIKHKRMFENLVECMQEFNSFAKSSGVELRSDGLADFSKITVDYFYKWFYINNVKPMHIHEEKSDEDPV